MFSFRSVLKQNALILGHDGAQRTEQTLQVRCTYTYDAILAQVSLTRRTVPERPCRVPFVEEFTHELTDLCI